MAGCAYWPLQEWSNGACYQPVPLGYRTSSAARGVFNSKGMGFSIKRLQLLHVGLDLSDYGHHAWPGTSRHRPG